MKTLSVVSDTQSLAALRVLFFGGYWMGAMDVSACIWVESRIWAPAWSSIVRSEPGALDYGERPYDRGTFGPVYLKWEAIRPIVEQHDPDLVGVLRRRVGLFIPKVADELRKTRCLIGLAMSESGRVRPGDTDHFPEL